MSCDSCVTVQVVDPKVSVDLEAGRKLAASLLDSAITAQASAENEMYPFLLVRQQHCSWHRDLMNGSAS